MDPSLNWKIRVESWGTKSSSLKRISSLIKKAASAKRARITCSLPSVTVSSDWSSPLRTAIKYGSSSPVRFDHREVTLVFLHNRDQNLGRKFQRFGVKFTQQSSRTFHQVVDFIQQVLIHFGFATHRDGQFGNLFRDDGPCVLCGSSRIPWDFSTSKYASAEVMATSSAAPKRSPRVLLVGGQTGILEGNNLCTKHGHQPAHRT